MLDINHILVVLDSNHPEHNAVEKAIWLAGMVKADLTFMTTAYEPNCDDPMSLEQETRQLIREAKLNNANSWVRGFINDALSTDLTIHTDIRWSQHLHDAVLEVMEQQSFDLVIKGTHPHSVVDKIFTHTDWHMIRHCPAPVMLVKSATPWLNNRILASIDATSMDENHQRINDNILAFSEHLADHLETDLHIVNAYPDVDVAFAMVPEISAPNDVQKHISSQHHEACHSLANKYNIKNDHIHIMEGDTTDVIPEIADAINVDLLVAGTVGRTGLASVVVGNTAEDLVDKIQCDIVVIKPSDGVDPDTE